MTKAESKVFILPKVVNHLQNKSSPVQRRVVENHSGGSKAHFYRERIDDK